MITATGSPGKDKTMGFHYQNLTISPRGWLQEATAEPSSHYNCRPQGEISLLVIHNISLPPGKYGSTDIADFFCGKLDPRGDPYFSTITGLEVSAHCLIRRTGEIVQFVSFLDRAWHAGRSEFRGRSACNDFSLGIELEGTDFEAFAPEQYESLIQLTRTLMAEYPLITRDRITGHSDIAPGRKTDPGPHFDWNFYLSELSE